MKQSFLILLSIVILSSCRHTTGSGNIITEKRSVGNFKHITVSDAFEVEVKIGPVVEVVVEADDNIMRHIRTSVDDGDLEIETEDLHNLSNAHLKAYVTVPTLNGISVSASASVVVKGELKNTKKLSFNLSSSGSIKAVVDAPEVNVEVSSAGTVDLKGRTRDYDAEVSSGGDINSGELLSENTHVSASSGGSARVHASVKLVADASSGGAVTYYGAAKVESSTSSGGSVDRGN